MLIYIERLVGKAVVICSKKDKTRAHDHEKKRVNKFKEFSIEYFVFPF